MASGDVPPDADRDHWRQVLDDSTRWSTLTRRLTAVLGSSTVVLALLAAALSPTARLYALVLAAVFVVITVTAERLARRNLHRARRLRGELAAP